MAMVWFYAHIFQMCAWVRVCVGGVSWDGVRLRSSYVDGSPHKDSKTRMCICACLCFFKCYIMRRIHILTSKVRTFLWDDWGLKLAWLLVEVVTNASVPVRTQIKILICLLVRVFVCLILVLTVEILVMLFVWTTEILLVISASRCSKINDAPMTLPWLWTTQILGSVLAKSQRPPRINQPLSASICAAHPDLIILARPSLFSYREESFGQPGGNIPTLATLKLRQQLFHRRCDGRHMEAWERRCCRSPESLGSRIFAKRYCGYESLGAWMVGWFRRCPPLLCCFK